VTLILFFSFSLLNLFQYRTIVRDLSQQLLRCFLEQGVLRHNVDDGDVRVNLDQLERGKTFLPGQRPQSTSTPRTTSTTVGGSVFYTAGTGTTEPFVTINLNGDDNDNGGGAAAAAQDGAGGTGGGASGGGAGNNAGGEDSAGGGACDRAGRAGVGDGDDTTNYGNLTTVVKDSGFGDGTPTHSGVAGRLSQAVRKGAVRFSEEAIELTSSEYFLSNILLIFSIYFIVFNIS
jgi:hypothetical protein